MNRGRIYDVDRERLVNAFRQGRDWLNVADTLGINRQSARNIIVKFRRNGEVVQRPRGGARRIKMDQQMIEFCVAQIEAKPTITLKEINENLRTDLQDKPYVTQQCISKKLDGLFYTIKDFCAVPIQWNTPEVKAQRRDFAEWLTRDGQNIHKIFVDEFGVNVWTSRSKGRAPQGQRAVRIIEGQRGRNLTICLAVSSVVGLVHYVAIEGGMTQELFVGFIMEIAQLMQINDIPFVVLCDNVASHKNMPNFGDQGFIKYLPKYSPFLNACEMADLARKRP